MVLCISVYSANAQQAINSPYSIEGMGNLSSGLFTHQEMMGGLNRALAEEGSFSFNNPASLSHLKVTDLEFGAYMSGIQQSTTTQKKDLKTGQFSSLAYAFPISLKRKVSFAVGLLPYSNTGYLFSNSSTEDSSSVITFYDGSGGIDQFKGAVGFELKKGISLGYTSTLLFGNIFNTFDKQYVNNRDKFSYRDVSTTYYNGFKHDFGVQFYGRLKRKFDWNLGLTYSPSTNITATPDRLVRTYNSAGNFFIDTIFESAGIKQTIAMPQTIGAAFTFQKTDRWMLGAEFSSTQWSTYKGVNDAGGFANQTIMSFGGFYQAMTLLDYSTLPGRKDRRNKYYKALRYYFGIRMQNNYMQFHGTQISETGINFGIGFPILRTYDLGESTKILVTSRATVGLEYINRGTTDNNLIQEQIFRLKVGVSFNDKWFVKRKYQ